MKHGSAMVLAIALAIPVAASATADNVSGAPGMSTVEPGRPVPVTPDGISKLDSVINESARLIDGGKPEEAGQLLSDTLADPQFALAPLPKKTAVWLLAGVAAGRTGDAAHAFDMLQLANASPYAIADGFLDMFFVAMWLDRHEAAAAAATTLVTRWPDDARKLDEQYVYRLAHELRKNAALQATQVAFLDALFDAGWKHRDGRQASALWRELVLQKINSGDLPRATVVAARVRAADEILRMKIDKRYDPALAALPAPQLDVRKAAAEEIDVLSASIKEEPRRLKNVVMLTYALLDTGKFTQALQICEATLEKAARGGEPAPYEDLDELIWIRDNRARALLRLDRVDEAVKVWEEASRMPEHGRDNVSQAINLAVVYGELGRADDALASLARVKDNVSPFGRMQYHAARLGALAATLDAPLAVESLAYQREHHTDAEETAMEMLLDAGHMDEAARSLIALLANPITRNDALASVQAYPTVDYTPIVAERNARKRQLIARPEVLKAIEDVGRLVEAPIYRVSW